MALSLGSVLYATPIFVNGITDVNGNLSVEGNAPILTSAPLFANGDVRMFYSGFNTDADLDVLYTDQQGDPHVLTGVNDLTPLGAEVDFGDLTGMITFELVNVFTGNTFYTGVTTPNPGQHLEAGYAPWTANTAIPVPGLFVAMGDNGAVKPNIDALTFVVTDVTVGPGPSSVPEPLSSSLVGGGLLVVGLMFRRRRKV